MPAAAGHLSLRTMSSCYNCCAQSLPDLYYLSYLFRHDLGLKCSKRRLCLQDWGASNGRWIRYFDFVHWRKGIRINHTEKNTEWPTVRAHVDTKKNVGGKRFVRARMTFSRWRCVCHCRRVEIGLRRLDIRRSWNKGQWNLLLLDVLSHTTVLQPVIRHISGEFKLVPQRTTHASLWNYYFAR